jgi:hypothetical protein
MDKTLIIILRISGVTLLLALGAVFMPHAWMDIIHRKIGLGELPAIPIIGYLTRSISAMYTIHGALFLFISLDVHRYLALVRFLAVTGGLFGFGMLLLDCYVGLPLPWVICEGPSIVVLGVVLFWLAHKVEKGATTNGSARQNRNQVQALND